MRKICVQTAYYISELHQRTKMLDRNILIRSRWQRYTRTCPICFTFWRSWIAFSKTLQLDAIPNCLVYGLLINSHNWSNCCKNTQDAIILFKATTQSMEQLYQQRFRHSCLVLNKKLRYCL